MGEFLSPWARLFKHGKLSPELAKMLWTPVRSCCGEKPDFFLQILGEYKKVLSRDI